MGSKWLPVPPLRRGLLGSAVRERRARRTVEESWAARGQADGSPIEPGLIVSLTYRIKSTRGVDELAFAIALQDGP